MGLKVIGVGGPRTGTTSLKDALEILGFGKCLHMESLFNDPDLVKYWVELFETGTTDFDTLFDGFQSTSDFPGYMLYKELYERYPDAKFILTLRDPEAWYESAYNTVYSVTQRTIWQKLGLMKKMLLSARFRKLAKVFGLVRTYLWGRQFQGQFHDKEKALEIYTRFSDEIRAFIPADQLLEIRISEGWEPLCAFLNVPVPDVPFPHKNQRRQFHEQISNLLETGGELKLQ